MVIFILYLSSIFSQRTYVIYALEPYVPNPPFIVGETSSNTSDNQNQDINIGANQSSGDGGIEILSSGDIGQKSDQTFNFLEKIRVYVLGKIQQEKNSFDVSSTYVKEGQSVGVNIANAHNSFLLLILNTGVYIFSHKFIFYSILVILIFSLAKFFL